MTTQITMKTSVILLHKGEDGKEYGLRSTSMNDQMLYGTKKYKVAMAGFEEIV